MESKIEKIRNIYLVPPQTDREIIEIIIKKVNEIIERINEDE